MPDHIHSEGKHRPRFDVVFSVRYTEEMYARVVDRAEAEGLSPAEYIRECVAIQVGLVKPRG